MSAPRLRRWLDARAADWERVDAQLQQRPRGALDAFTALRAVEDYRALSHDVAVARRELPGTDLVLGLEHSLHRMHTQLHREHEPWRERARRLYGDEIPALFAKLRPVLCLLGTLFIASALAAAALVGRYPELASLFASEQMIEHVEQGELWTDGLLNLLPSSFLSVRIIANNVVVSLMAFVLGSLYGLGTLYMVILNGAMLGGVFAFTMRHELGGRLLQFILAHGVVELSVIMIAAAAGVGLGEALARPGQHSRSVAFRLAVADGSKLLAVVVPFLALAGLIEGFVSPDASFGWWTRVAVGAASGWLLWVVATGRWRRSRALPPTG